MRAPPFAGVPVPRVPDQPRWLHSAPLWPVLRRWHVLRAYTGAMIVALVHILSGEDPKGDLRLVEERAERATGGGAELLIFNEATS